MQTPIVLLIFKRPDTTQQVLDRIRQVQPQRLFVVADGPRPDRIGEADNCAATRALIDQIDWNCQVSKHYSDTNLGCARRVSSGLDWVFEQVEQAIILEDDCVPDLTFFPFCEQLLEHYQTDERISSICAQNLLPSSYRHSYRFSCYQHSWGWATWRRAWQHFDFDLRDWQAPERQLARILNQPRATQTWLNIFQDVAQGRVDSWAYRWMFACWLRGSLSIHPSVNLVQNIGFGEAATHTIAASPLFQLQSGAIAFPLSHPTQVAQDLKADAAIQKLVFDTPLLERLKRNLRSLKKQLW
jgi:hypothetical protein